MYIINFVSLKFLCIPTPIKRSLDLSLKFERSLELSFGSLIRVLGGNLMSNQILYFWNSQLV